MPTISRAEGGQLQARVGRGYELANVFAVIRGAIMKGNRATHGLADGQLAAPVSAML
jgi:hypothetical protein